MKTPFPSTSRYATVEITQLARPDGTVIPVLRRRFVPDPAAFETLVEHPVASGERLDTITAAFLDDPEQYWRVCDANRAIRPAELTEELGRAIRITLPEGISGGR